MILTRKIFFVVAILCGVISSFAQKPSWTQYYERQNMYPEGDFLVGFVSGINTTDEDAGKLKSVYETMAKDKLIQGIQVEIETNNSLNVSNKNGKSDEEFLSKSVSISKANISGLTARSYYDRKKKEVYAIAFVNKKELTFYYRNLIKSGIEDIDQKLEEGQKYEKKGVKENALKSFYEAMPILSNIDEARALLIALNRKMYADIDLDKINSQKLELINEINLLLKPNDLNLSESAYFVAYGLFLQLGQIDGTIFIDDFTFENTGLISNFSKKWNQEFASALVSAGKYNVKISKGSTVDQTLVYGNYWKEGDFLKVSASVTKYGKLIAVSKGSIPLSWLTKENIEYIPEQIKKMNSLKGYQLLVKNTPRTIKLGMPTTTPLEIGLLNNLDGEGVAVEGIPVSIINTETGEILCISLTNNLGISTCYLPSVQTEKAVFRVEASIDLAEYLNIKNSSIFFTIASGQNPVLPVSIDLITENPTIFIQSKELSFDRQMDIKTLEPIVKETLAAKGYNFVDNEKDADYLIAINANTTTGSQYQGIYFAFLDVNISVIETSIGEEIYKTHFDQIKGGGSNYKKAGKKAYIISAQKIKESISDLF